jgi:hypothetical protein
LAVVTRSLVGMEAVVTTAPEVVDPFASDLVEIQLANQLSGA